MIAPWLATVLAFGFALHAHQGGPFCAPWLATILILGLVVVVVATFKGLARPINTEGP